MRAEDNQVADPVGRPKTVERFGWWPSPFTAGRVAAGKVSRSGLQSDGASLLWLESRPEDGGRQVVVTDGGGAAPVDVSPPAVSVRSRVHEYGGGAATAVGGGLYYVDQADQRLYRSAIGDGRDPVPLTPESEPGSSVRYADGSLTPSREWFVCIEERHDHSGTGHRVVAVATDGSRRVVALVDAGGFVAAPRPSPDGARLAWVGWNHPHMSWDRSAVWVSELDESDAGISIAGRHRVAGGKDVSVGQPRWCADGSLVVIDDRTGWWLPYRIPGDRLEEDDAAMPLVDLEAEFHSPDWALGQSTIAELPDGSLVCRMHRDSRDQLVRLHPPGQRPDPGPARTRAPGRAGR